MCRHSLWRQCGCPLRHTKGGAFSLEQWQELIPVHMSEYLQGNANVVCLQPISFHKGAVFGRHSQQHFPAPLLLQEQPERHKRLHISPSAHGGDDNGAAPGRQGEREVGKERRQAASGGGAHRCLGCEGSMATARPVMAVSAISSTVARAAGFAEPGAATAPRNRVGKLRLAAMNFAKRGSPAERRTNALLEYRGHQHGGERCRRHCDCHTAATMSHALTIVIIIAFKKGITSDGTSKAGRQAAPVLWKCRGQMDSHEGNSTRLIVSGAADAATAV